MTHSQDVCQFLDWDSNFFKQRIGRVNHRRLDPSLIKHILDWGKANQIDCMYFLAVSDDPQTIRLAEQNHFQMVEIRLIMGRSLKDWRIAPEPQQPNGILIRQAQTQDIPTLQEIASNSYVDSRFYFDTRFDPSKWQEYYATWVKKSCEGAADLALVAEMDGNLVGYITGNVNKDNPKEGIYELTGVAPTARRAGVGQALFQSGLDWYFQHGIEHVWLATQGRNIATQRMIQRNGFLTQDCQVYYHKWFTHSGQDTQDE